MSARSTVVLSSAQVRALAHPLRLRLLVALRVAGPATATALAQRLGTNTGQTSYHLRQLAEVGLIVEDDARGRGRERWWRAAHDAHDWSAAARSGDPDDQAAVEWMAGSVAALQSRWLEAWLREQDDWSQDWQDASDLSDWSLELTPEQARALVAELHAVVERHRQAVGGSSPHPEAEEGARQFIVQLRAFPRPELEL